MISKVKVAIIFFSLSLGIGISGDLQQHFKVNDAAKSWIVDRGHPLYYTSTNSLYLVEGQSLTNMPNYSADSEITLSPSGEYRLLALLQKMNEVRDSQRFSDFFVLDGQNKLAFKVSRGTPSDLKPLIAAVSDKGTLALADPVSAKLYLYNKGNLISEVQLFEDEGALNMERNIQLKWIDDQCFIMLERPGFNGEAGGNVLFIRVNSNGRDQITSILPIQYLQQLAFGSKRFFISGYNYNSNSGQIEPLIVEVSKVGEVLWTNQNYGHELVLSSNGKYLAVLSSHASMLRFDLGLKRIKQINFDHEDKISLGMTVNNSGEVAVIRVPVDFFVKKNTYFADIFLPLSDRSIPIQMDPRFLGIFKLHTDGKGIYVGTNYEWLEVN